MSDSTSMLSPNGARVLNIPYKSVMAFAIKLLMKILLHATFISLKFSAIALAIVPP